MAQVRLHPGRLTGASTTPVIATGTYIITPVEWVETTDFLIEQIPLPPVDINAAAVTITLPDLQSFRFEFISEDNLGGEYRSVKIYSMAVSGAVHTGVLDLEDWDELPQVPNPPTNQASMQEILNRLTALEEAVAAGETGGITGSGPLGEIMAQDIYGSGTTGRNVLEDETPGDIRSTIGAAASSHTHVATTDLTATGTKNTTTFLRGDNTWGVPPGAATPDWGSITGIPATFPPDPHTHTIDEVGGLQAYHDALEITLGDLQEQINDRVTVNDLSSNLSNYWNKSEVGVLLQSRLGVVHYGSGWTVAKPAALVGYTTLAIGGPAPPIWLEASTKDWWSGIAA